MRAPEKERGNPYKLNAEGRPRRRFVHLRVQMASAPVVPAGSEISVTVCCRDMESSCEAHSRSLEPLPLEEPTFSLTVTYWWKLST